MDVYSRRLQSAEGIEIRGVTVIRAAEVERLLATGKTAGEIAEHFGCDRGTLYYRRRVDPEFREAFARGQRRWSAAGRARCVVRDEVSVSTADALLSLLTEILNDLKELGATYEA